MQMKPRERWRGTWQRHGTAEINEGGSRGAVWENGKRAKWGVMHRGAAGYRNRENVSVDGERRLNPAGSESTIRTTC